MDEDNSGEIDFQVRISPDNRSDGNASDRGNTSSSREVQRVPYRTSLHKIAVLHHAVVTEL